jgi:hypothetical protein
LLESFGSETLTTLTAKISPRGRHSAAAPLKGRGLDLGPLHPPTQLLRLHLSSTISRCVCLLIALVGVHASVVWGQGLPTATTRFDAGLIATAGGMNTQLPYYADSALGYNFGLYLQPYSVLGVELRGGFYPVSARFEQAPVTAGVHLQRRKPFLARLQPLAYFGGGFSKAQDSSTSYKPLAAIWSPCWQGSEGLDVPLGRIKWRVYEATWTETFAGRRDVPRRDLRSLSLSTGFVYSFKF